MAKPKKKPKTGDVVGWVVVNGDMSVDLIAESRHDARKLSNSLNAGSPAFGPYRIAKIVLAK